MKKFLWITLVLAVMTIANVKAKAQEIRIPTGAWGNGGGIIPNRNFSEFIDQIDNSPVIVLTKCIDDTIEVNIPFGKIKIPGPCLTSRVSLSAVKQITIFYSIVNNLVGDEVQRRNGSNEVFKSNSPRIQDAVDYINKNIKLTWDPKVSMKIQEKVGFGFISNNDSMSNLNQVIAGLSTNVLSQLIQNANEFENLVAHTH